MASLNRRRRRLLVYGGTGAAAVGGLYWFTGRATVANTTQVRLTSGSFQPQNIKVDQGATVTWRNTTDFTQVISSGENWDLQGEQQLQTGGRGVQVSSSSEVQHTFEESGVYEASNPTDGSRMKIAVGDASIEDPVGGWF